MPCARSRTWNPAADGSRLAARVWLPVDARGEPVPASWSPALPEGRLDGLARRADAPVLRRARLRRRARGPARQRRRPTASSDEYHPQEQDDPLEVIAWIAAPALVLRRRRHDRHLLGRLQQPAARRPPPPGAEGDHHAYAPPTTATTTTSTTWAAACSPRPAALGDGDAGLQRPPARSRRRRRRLAGLWLARLEQTPPYIDAVARHQRRDAYWRHGSVCEDYAAIAFPVLRVGGWADGYTNAVLRLLDGLPGPRKGLIGPWAHSLPSARPGPRSASSRSACAGGTTGSRASTPASWTSRCCGSGCMDCAAAGAGSDEGPGRWVAEPCWPSPGSHPQGARAGDGCTAARPPAAGAALPSAAPCSPGGTPASGAPRAAGRLPSGPAGRRRPLADLHLPPLAEPLDLLGFPEQPDAGGDRPLALVAARLCDVAPDGASTLVTRGLLNLTHRDSHAHPAPLEPGRRYAVTVPLNAIGQSVPAGHRLRLALSPTYWPRAWPSPCSWSGPTLFAGGDSWLTLPVRPNRPDDARSDPSPPPFDEPETAPGLEVVTLRHGDTSLTTATDVVQGRHSWVRHVDRPRSLAPRGERDRAGGDRHRRLRSRRGRSAVRLRAPLPAVALGWRRVTGRPAWRRARA